MKISSFSVGAVTALHRLTRQLGLAESINRAIAPEGKVQVRDSLTVGESLVTAMIARACAPRSKRAFADWASTTWLPELMDFKAADLTSRHFRDQMNAVPVDKLFRCSLLIDMTGRKGRPRVRLQIEEMEAGRKTLAEAVGAMPALG